MVEAGADLVSNGDSLAGPDVIAPALYRRLALPYEQQVAAHAHRLGVPYLLHICGNTTGILADWINSGAEALEMDFKTDASRAHLLCRERVTFVGNLDPVGVLLQGTPALVEARTRELGRLFADTPRFILNAGCAIPPGTPPENLRAMIRAARELQLAPGAVTLAVATGLGGSRFSKSAKL
jgi:MtaA/CmuA family methyltransferase